MFAIASSQIQVHHDPRGGIVLLSRTSKKLFAPRPASQRSGPERRATTPKPELNPSSAHKPMWTPALQRKRATPRRASTPLSAPGRLLHRPLHCNSGLEKAHHDPGARVELLLYPQVHKAICLIALPPVLSGQAVDAARWRSVVLLLLLLSSSSADLQMVIHILLRTCQLL